jgi:hypothetical protein
MPKVSGVSLGRPASIWIRSVQPFCHCNLTGWTVAKPGAESEQIGRHPVHQRASQMPERNQRARSATAKNRMTAAITQETQSHWFGMSIDWP